VLITSITRGDQDLALFASCLLGVSVGFLWFKRLPGDDLHGDTGSLAGRADRRSRGDDPYERSSCYSSAGILRGSRRLGGDPVISSRGLPQRVFMMAPDPSPPSSSKGWSETKIILRFWDHRRGRRCDRLVIYQHAIKAPIQQPRRAEGLVGDENIERLPIIAALASRSASRSTSTRLGEALELPGGPYLVVGLRGRGAASLACVPQSEQVIGLDQWLPRGGPISASGASDHTAATARVTRAVPCVVKVPGCT